MFTPIQQVMLTCLFIEPEDARGFDKFLDRESHKRGLLRGGESRRARRREEYRKRNPKKESRWTPEFVAGYGRKYRTQNLVDLQNKKREYVRNRLRSDPGFRLRHYLRSRLWRPLLGHTKGEKTAVLLGCSFPELRAHLERQFQPGMTWENYGPVWHVDHKRPLASFDLTRPEQQRQCCHFSNLQPLFAADNLKKGAKIDYCT